MHFFPLSFNLAQNTMVLIGLRCLLHIEDLSLHYVQISEQYV